MIYNKSKREQRCIELFDRLKQQFSRAHALDDADKGYYPNQPVSWPSLSVSLPT